MNSSFLLVETNFLSCRNSIVLFRALLKILKFGGSNLFKRNLISARGSCFFGQQKLNFSIFQILLLVKVIFVQQKRVFERIFHSAWWRRILCLVETGFSYLIFFFYKRKPSLKLVETNLFGKDFVSVERDVHPVETVFFYSVLVFRQWKPLLKLVEISCLYFL